MEKQLGPGLRAQLSGVKSRLAGGEERADRLPTWILLSPVFLLPWPHAAPGRGLPEN